MLFGPVYHSPASCSGSTQKMSKTGTCSFRFCFFFLKKDSQSTFPFLPNAFVSDQKRLLRDVNRKNSSHISVSPGAAATAHPINPNSLHPTPSDHTHASLPANLLRAGHIRTLTFSVVFHISIARSSAAHLAARSVAVVTTVVVVGYQPASTPTAPCCVAILEICTHYTAEGGG